jgi:hypothetical protein
MRPAHDSRVPVRPARRRSARVHRHERAGRGNNLLHCPPPCGPRLPAPSSPASHPASRRSSGRDQGCWRASGPIPRLGVGTGHHERARPFLAMTGPWARRSLCNSATLPRAAWPQSQRRRLTRSRTDGRWPGPFNRPDWSMARLRAMDQHGDAGLHRICLAGRNVRDHQKIAAAHDLPRTTCRTIRHGQARSRHGARAFVRSRPDQPRRPWPALRARLLRKVGEVP